MGHDFLNHAVLDPNVPQGHTRSSDICKNGWYLLLLRTILQSVI